MVDSQVPSPGEPGSGQMVRLSSGARAYLCTPRQRATAGVLLFHEWWGLNHYVRSQAEKLVRQGYLALALDLYAGKVASDQDEAMRLMKAVDPAVARNHVKAALGFLRTDAQHRVARVGTIGWCFGGAWALRAAVAGGKGVHACVVFYGEVPGDPAKLESLTAPVLGVFATRDRLVTPKMVADFASAMRTAGKALERVDIAADHAFSNPSSPNHDGAAARGAWDRTLAFFASQLR